MPRTKNDKKSSLTKAKNPDTVKPLFAKATAEVTKIIDESKQRSAADIRTSFQR
jgi:hypothetical protein